VRSIKFLFLPAEHDPDTFIREFGSEAFAAAVAEATPLSRFMIEAACEGCDLGSAEGRARLSSNARPLWGALPDGALKRQLLAELAGLVQLDGQDLVQLWGPMARPRPSAPPDAHPGGHAGAHSGAFGDEGPPNDAPWFGDGERRPRDRERDRDGRRFGARFSRQPAFRPTPGGRTLPTSRADVALRLLLSNTAQWEPLSHELHELLCNLTGEHGLLFSWLDSQMHEHGAQPWAALREGLRGLSFEPLAVRVMTGPDGGPIGSAEGERADDAARELRNVLDYMLDDLLKLQQSETIAAVGSDPRALERYKALEARRLELRKRLQSMQSEA
jgi:DNA primase